jgi:hypothetical protein
MLSRSKQIIRNTWREDEKDREVYMKVTICDRCGGKISGNTFEIAVEKINQEGLEEPWIQGKKMMEKDFCKNCIEKIIGYALNPDENDEDSKETVVSAKSGSKRGKIDDEILRRKYEQGIPVKDIAEIFGVAENSVYMKIRKLKLTRSNTQGKSVNPVDCEKQKDCVFKDSKGACLYILHTGHRRPCKADVCTVYSNDPSAVKIKGDDEFDETLYE